MSRRPRSITHRIEAFPYISTVTAQAVGQLERGTIRPIMSFVSTRPPQGYVAWCRLYKKRGKAGG